MKLTKGAKGAVAKLSHSGGDQDTGELSHLLTARSSWVVVPPVPPFQSTLELPLLEGETLSSEFPDVTNLGRPCLQGGLAITNYRLYFHAATLDRSVTLDIPLGFITKVDKVTTIPSVKPKQP